MQKYTKPYRELISEYTDKTNKADTLIIESLGITPEGMAIINMLSKESVMDPTVKPVNAILNVVKNIVSYLEGATSKDVAVSKDITVVKKVAVLLAEAVAVLNERIEIEKKEAKTSESYKNDCDLPLAGIDLSKTFENIPF